MGRVVLPQTRKVMFRTTGDSNGAVGISTYLGIRHSPHPTPFLLNKAGFAHHNMIGTRYSLILGFPLDFFFF